MFDKERMFFLMAERPGIRCVELADELNVDRELIAKNLKPYIEKGDVQAFEVRAPNGMKVLSYDFTDKFKTSDVYKVLAAPYKRPDPKMNVDARVAAAKDFLFEHGRSTTVQLKNGMGIYCKPEIYLSKQIASGEILRNGNYWWLPSDHVASPAQHASNNTAPSRHPATPEKVEEPETLPVGSGKTGSGEANTVAPELTALAQEGKADTPEPELLEAAQENSAPNHPSFAELAADIFGLVPQEAEPLEEPASVRMAASIPTTGATSDNFNCAVWADGTFEFKDGALTHRLSQEKFRKMLGYLDRILEPVTA